MNKNFLGTPFDLLQVLEQTFDQATNGKNRHQALLPVDVVESESQYLVYADIPGVGKENITIEFNKGDLSIDVASRAPVEKQENDKFVLNERRTSKKSRVLHFGENIDSDSIKAAYQDGVLMLTVPKREVPVNSKKINIE